VLSRESVSRILWGCSWKFFTNVPSDSGSWV
jgi:hypothetical protein